MSLYMTTDVFKPSLMNAVNAFSTTDDDGFTLVKNRKNTKPSSSTGKASLPIATNSEKSTKYEPGMSSLQILATDLDEDEPKIAESASNHPLKSTWCFWFHMIDNDSWDVKSYRMVYSFDNIRDFWRMQNNMPPVFSGMFFVMKKGIMPVYEDKHNLNGALYSFRIVKKELQKVWNELLLALIGDTLYPDYSIVNGVSINPKSCVIKVWLLKPPERPERCKITNRIPYLMPDKALYLKPRDGIKSK